MNLNQAVQVIVRTHIAALNAGHRANAIELKSGPGIGKSSAIDQTCALLARMLNEPVGLTIEMLATIQSIDIRGFMIPQKTSDGKLGTIFSTPPWYPAVVNTIVFTPDGRKYLKGEWTGPTPRVGITFLDEFGQADDDCKKAAAELVLHGEVGNTRLPQGWRVIAASNRLSDRAGVMRALTFVTNRRMEILVEGHLPTWNDWVDGLDIAEQPHHLTVSFANKSPDLVFRDAVPPGDGPFCTPRTLILMDRDLRALRSKEEVVSGRLPMDGVAREVCSGWIGGGESAQYFTHIRFADLLPDIADIEKDPMTAKLPAARDAQMVCAYMLAHNVSPTNGDKIIRYINRLNIEMQTLAVQTITKQPQRGKMVANSPMFTKWLIDHKDLLIAAHA